MDAQTKVKLEQRAAAGLVVLFAIVLTSTLRTLGVFNRRPAAAFARPATVASNSAPPTLPSVVEEYRRKMEPQVELPSIPSTSEPSETTSYTAHELRDPLEPLLPRQPEPESSLTMSASPELSPEWATPTAPPTPHLVVQGLWWGGSQPRAIINDEVYGVGDTVGGAIIRAIGRAGVTIEFAGQTIQLAPAPTQEPVRASMSPGPPWK